MCKVSDVSVRALFLLDQRPILRVSFNPNYFSKLIPNAAHWRLMISHWELVTYSHSVHKTAGFPF